MIQVDMFEVQLGASLLLQFITEKRETVRVLADAGQGGLDPNVHSKLTNAFIGDAERRIDLLMGTHYDADHLDGLIPIIQDENIAITEAWLPPVANDSEQHAFDEPLADLHLLPNQFYSSSGRQVLNTYLDTKRRICEQLKPGDREPNIEDEPVEKLRHDNDLDEKNRMFKGYRDEAVSKLRFGAEGPLYTHANDDQFVPIDLKELLELSGNSASNWRWYPELYYDDPEQLTADIVRSVKAGSTAAHNLAGIRKSAASDAINAISLFKVVEALHERKIPVPMVCHVIQDGTPRRFAWRTASRRFEGCAKLPAQGPEIMLLGPSESLVKKHWNRLPIGTYAALARFALIRLKSITPSNQLSYTARFEAEKQGILVTGDAGCVDFKPSHKAPYYRKLLATLLPLHVVQVAHHAGNNAHFYRVLLEAKYPQRVAHSFLLVSHATDDEYRPSGEFARFAKYLRQDPEIVSILFTAKPKAEKVRDFKPLVHLAVGPVDSKGDARLEFRGTWAVTRHSIQV